MGAVIGLILFFCPVIIYVLKKRDYETQVILASLIGMFIGSEILINLFSWIFGKEYQWYGAILVWITAMYLALKD